MYRSIASGMTQAFEITGGLKEGYGDGAIHSIDDVLAAHHAWQEETKLIMGVFIAPAVCSYGFPDGDAIRSDSEPGFVLSGTINVLYQADWTYQQREDALRSLASFVAEALGQVRIYMSFAGTTHILERPT